MSSLSAITRSWHIEVQTFSIALGQLNSGKTLETTPSIRERRYRIPEFSGRRIQAAHNRILDAQTYVLTGAKSTAAGKQKHHDSLSGSVFLYCKCNGSQQVSLFYVIKGTHNTFFLERNTEY
jgi:hypothetical protein